MTKPTAPPAADLHARLQAASTELALAAAAVAELDTPVLEAALAALDGSGAELAASLRPLHEQLATDPTAQQALANVWMIQDSARQILRARLAVAQQAIAAGSPQP